MHATMNSTDLPQFTVHKQKLLASILALIEEAAKDRQPIITDEIVKSLFIADDAHLYKYGRPITFDNYTAEEQGPVGDMAADMLSDKVDWSVFDLNEAPWRKQIISGLEHYGPGTITSQRMNLSPSDVEGLTEALRLVKSIGDEQAAQKTRAHHAWRSAWYGRGRENDSVAMDWREFPEVDPERIGDLVHASKYQA